jgi:hypothetical protein
MTDEISRAERARQDRLAEKPKETEKPKDGPSQFDRVLEESRSLQRALPPTQTTQRFATEQATREAQRRDDRSHDDSRKDEKDKDQGKDQGRGEKKSGTRDADQKVVAKRTIKDDRGGGGEGRGGYGGGHGRRSVASTQLKTISKALTPSLHGKFAEKLQASIAKSVAEPGLSQAILNKLVQYVRLGINRMGDKEIQIDLHEKVFRGLKLRITSHKGKVDVHFMTADAKTRSVFEKNTDAIRDALEKKGILVEEIRVT